MRPGSARPVTSFLAVALLLSPYSFAFDTPLSDQAVREAYFLGQRRDETMAALLNKIQNSFRLRRPARTSIPSPSSLLSLLWSSNPASTPPVTALNKLLLIIAT